MGDSERRWPELARGLTTEGQRSFRAAFEAFRAKGEEGEKWEKWWAKAELRAAQLITSIQPNPESERRRQDVVDYVTELIQSCVNCKVVKFGSVPLKTYLPDGDIDLTVVSPNLDAKRTWIDDVHNALQKEINNPKSEFRVTQVHLVSAEVKIIKIYVEKLLVDVSFDQLGGLGTLCFLEEVDRLVGDDHLFKRSVILVKAWCYYESRILGANCNLMSTYALETLVLYIFNLFHASLRGPLQVLYLFVEFFSNFDWDKYCVSLSSPILRSSFSEDTERQPLIKEDFQRLALSPRREGGELLFTKAFLDACERSYGFMPVNQLAKPTKFAVKSLNIIDPLRSTNNVGRSVNQGNCARIRRAFDLGARTLRGILHSKEADVSAELDQFFKNCKSRYHGSGQRPDVAGPSSSQGITMPNGVQKMGVAKRRDAARTDRNEDSSVSSQNGDYLLQERLYHNTLPRVDSKATTARETSQQALGSGVQYEGARILSPAAELASCREEMDRESAGNLTEELAPLTFGTFSGSNGVHMSLDSRRVDEEERVDMLVLERIPNHIASLEIACNQLPVRSRADGEDDMSPAMFSERRTSSHAMREELESLVASMGDAGVLKQGSTVNGGQRSANGSTSPCSKNDSEEEEESSSQSSSSNGGGVTASENTSVLGVIDTERGSLPLSCRPENSESSRHGSSSELPGRPPDPRRSIAAAARAEEEAQTPSRDRSVSVRNEEEREFSVPVNVHKQQQQQPGTNPGLEYSGVVDVSQSRGPRRKGKLQQQNGTFQTNEFGSGVVHVRRKRGLGKDKLHGRAATQDGGQVSDSAGSAYSPQQASVVASAYQYSPRPSVTDHATAGSHFKASQSRSSPNATGPGSLRYPFDPGTARMAAASSSSAPSHSTGHQYSPSYYPPPPQLPPGFPHSSSQSMNNFHKRNSLAKGDGGGSGGNAKSRMDPDTVEAAAPPENSVDSSSPSHRNPFKLSSEQVLPQLPVGIVERLEASGIPASTSSRRSQTAAAARSNADGGAGGNENSEFLTGDLRLHLGLLAYGRSCEDSWSPNVQYQIGHPPAYSSDLHAHLHKSWEGPDRPGQLMGHPGFYAPGPSWFPLFHQQAGYYRQQLQPFWGPRGVELSPRPRGTGTYLPNSQLRQNIKGHSGRGRGGVSQNGSSSSSSSQQEGEKYHHQSREHENSNHFHGAHPRAPSSKDEAHAAGAAASAAAGQGTSTSTRAFENRSALRTERARDSSYQQPRQELAMSLPTSPSISSPSANTPLPEQQQQQQLPHPIEVLLCSSSSSSDLNSPTYPLDVRKPPSSCDDSLVEMLSGSNEGLPVLESLCSEEMEAMPDGGKELGPALKGSAGVGGGDLYEQLLVLCDDYAGVLTGLPSSVATSSLRIGSQTYHMKDEDFPPLGIRQVNRAEGAGAEAAVASPASTPAMRLAETFGCEIKD